MVAKIRGLVHDDKQCTFLVWLGFACPGKIADRGTCVLLKNSVPARTETHSFDNIFHVNDRERMPI